MLGRSKEERISLKRDEISDVTDPRLEPALEERGKKGHFKGELNYLRKDGTSFPVDVTSTIFKDSNGIERSSIIARDITERKKSEEALRINNVRLSLAMSVAKMAWWEMNIVSGSITFEKRKAEMLGYLPDNFNHYTDFMKLVHPEDAERAMEAMRRHIYGSEEKYEVEYRILTKEGDYKWFYDIGSVTTRDSNGKSIIVTGLVIDITDRKRSEELLRQSNEQYKSLFQDNHSVMLLIHPETGKIVDANPTACTYYGWSHAEICHLNIDEINSLSKEEIAGEMQLAKEEQRNHFFFRHRLATNEIRDVEVYSGPIRFGDETMLYSIVHDVTDKTLIEEALRQSETSVRLKLQSILSPEGSITELDLSDIIDVPSIQKLMDNFYGLTQIPMAIIDVKGKVLVGTGWQDICTKFHRVHPDSCRNCIESDVYLTEGIPDGEFRIYKCKNNMWDIATPIIIGEEHKGNLFIGQFFLDNETIDYDMFREQALKYGFDEPDYIEALDNAPRLSQQKLGQAKAFFLNLSRSISQLSYSNIKLARAMTQQKLDEETLQKNKDNLRAILDATLESIYLFDINGEVIEANATAATRLKSEIEGIKGQKLSTILPKEISQSRLMHLKEVFQSGKSVQFEDKRDEYIFEHNFFPVFNNGIVENVVSFSRDITRQKKATKALRTSERQLDAVFNSVAETIIMLDTKGKILTANHTSAKRWGMTVEEMIGKNMFEFTSPETQKKREDQIQKMIETASPVRFEDELNGAVFDLTFYPIKDSSGEINQFVMFNRDITERRRAQEALKANEERYSMIYNSSRDSIFSLDIHGYLTSANRSFCEEFKLELSQVLKKTFGEIGLPEYLCQELDKLKRQVTESNSTILSELTVRILDNSTRYYEVILNPMHDDKGNVAGFGGSVRNITKRKEASEALIESEKRFRYLIKDIPVGVLLYGPQAELITNNPKVLELLGLSEVQLKNNSMHEINWDAIHEDGSTYRNIEYPALHAYSTGQSVRDVVVGINQSANEITWLLMNAEVVSRSDGSVRNVVCSFIDITRMKEAENALKESEEKFRNLIWDMQVGVLLNGPDSNVLVCNPKAIELLGLTEDQMLGKTSYDAEWEAIHEDGSPFEGNTHPVVQAIATGKPVRDVIMGVFQPILKKYVWLLIDAVPKFDKDGKLLNALVTFIDVTTLKNTQNELKESEFFFRETQQAAFIGSYKTDFNTGVWESSEVLDDIFGIDKTYDRTVEGWLNIAHPEDREMMNHYLMEDVLMKGDQFNKEYRIVRKNDQITRWVHGLGRVDFDTDSKVKSLIGTIQDITDRKIKEEALRKLNKTLAALSKSSQAMSQSSVEAEYLNQVCNIVVEDTDFAMVWIGYAEDDAAKTIRPMASAGFNDDYLDNIKLSWDDNESGSGPTGVAIRTGKVGMCNNMLTDPTFKPWREQALKRGYASSIVFPLKSEDKIFGAITIYSKKTDSFLEDEIELLTKLASDLAHGITTLRLRQERDMAEEALLKSHSELEKTVMKRTEELVKTNDALQRTEVKYRTVADFANNWEFWISPDDQMIYCSPSCEHITGFSYTEFVINTQLILDIIHPEDLQLYKDHKNKEISTHICEHEVQYRIFKKDGTIRWIGHFCRPVFDESGNYLGVRGSNKDITARKKMEELLTTSNQKYKLLSENINDGIFICKNGKFEYSNAAMYEIFGYSVREIEKMKLTELLMSDYHEELENLLYSNASSNRSCNVEVECLRKDFNTVFVEILLNYVAKDKTVYGVVHDITEKKEFQKSMVKAIIQTEEKERAHFSKELHDGLGPLLSTIKLYLQWSERPNSNKSREEIIGKAGEILEEALATVKEVSNKLSPHLLINYGLNSAIKSFVEKLNATANYKIIFESNTARRIGAETEAALYRATIECINNTLKYAHANNIFIKLEDTGSQIMLNYRDDGKGFDITETIAEHKGLGLFNLQNRLHTIGGKVELHSELGKGVDYLFTVNV
jgi:PAS domain S-box-containing protein